MTTRVESVGITAEEFRTKYVHEKGIELVRGRIVRLGPFGAMHGYVCANLSGELGIFLKSHRFGTGLSHNVFVQTESSPATFRGPDLQYFSYERMPKGTVPIGIPAIPPDLVFEVRAHDETWKSLTRKALEYLDADVKVVVLFDPDDKTATVFRADGKSHTYAEDQTLTLPDVLPGFALPLSTVFA